MMDWGRTRVCLHFPFFLSFFLLPSRENEKNADRSCTRDPPNGLLPAIKSNSPCQRKTVGPKLAQLAGEVGPAHNTVRTEIPSTCFIIQQKNQSIKSVVQIND
jgi:hypothetical protein